MNKWGQASRVRKLSPFAHGLIVAVGPAAIENADCTPKPVTETHAGRAGAPAAYRPDSEGCGCGSSPRGPTTPAISGSAIKRSRPV